MKKLLSLVLVLLMILGIVACGTTKPAETPAPVATQAPAAEKPAEQPTEAPKEPEAPKATYVALGLNIKNKTGVTIDEVYIYPAGGDKGNSVVAPGWQDKDADKANYEKDIYIVREAGAAQELLVVFADGTEAKKDLGELKMYTKISMKDGVDPAAWEVQLEDKAEDKAAMDAAVAVGKTADNVYPGYELLAIELKNKTGKNIVDFRFYEEGGDPNAYNNMIDYLYTAAGEKMASLMPGKAKEGGMYLFKCFLRPHTDNYNLYVKFDDGTDITYPIEDWFKPDGDGHLPNEISLKNAEDKYDIKVQYDDGDPEPLQYLAESLEKGYVVDQWYPVYEGAPAADAAAVEAARVELAKIPVPAAEEPAEEPVPAEEPAPVAEAAAVPEGYTGLKLMVKNKTGKDIAKIYLFPNGEDKGKNIFKTLADVLPTEDESKEGKPHEIQVYVLRETEKLGAMTLRVRFADDTEEDHVLEKPVEDYTVFTIKADEFKQKVTDDAEDMAAMDAVAAAGVSTDGVEYAPKAEEPAAAPAAAEVPAGYAGLALNIKNKTGKTINEVYIYAKDGDKGASVVEAGWKDKDADGDNYEKNIYLIREADKEFVLYVVFEDGTDLTEELGALAMYDKISMQADKVKHEPNDDPADIALMDEVVKAGVTADGWYPAA